MIRNLKMYTIFNSLGRETIKIKVFTDHGFYTASIPSGTSKGIHEAKELPVKKVSKIFSSIRPRIIGVERDWKEIDSLLKKLDGTSNFSKIGENLALAISIAAARALTQNELWKLGKQKIHATFPIPLGNVIGGGAHMGGTDWQEFLIIPHRAKNPHDAIKIMVDIWSSIGEELRSKKLLIGKNIENAWMTKMNDIKTLDFLADVAEDWRVKIGIDFAASNLWDGKVYRYKKLKKTLTPSKQIDFITEIADKYNLYYLEDPIQQDGFKSFMVLTYGLKNRLVVGDDLYCTNPERLKMGIKLKSTNSILIKPNQIGTLLQTQEVIDLAKQNGIIPIPSHRSGETEDNWISDLAIAWNAPLIKTGITGSDMPKLNRLVELWEEIPHVKMAVLP